MKRLHNLGHGQRPLGMCQPMEIDDESERIERSNGRLGVKLRIVQHGRRQVQRADAIPTALQVLDQPRISQRINFKSKRNGHKVGHRAVQNSLLPKIVNAGRVQQYQIALRH
jgi:hypothetical protein